MVRLTALDECLRKSNMALKSETGVHIECLKGEEPHAIEFALHVVVFNNKEEEEENA